MLKDSSADLSYIWWCLRGSLRFSAGEIPIVKSKWQNSDKVKPITFSAKTFADKSEASSFRNQRECNKYETSSKKKREYENLHWHSLFATTKVNGDFTEKKVFKHSLTALTFEQKNHKILKQSCFALQQTHSVLFSPCQFWYLKSPLEAFASGFFCLFLFVFFLNNNKRLFRVFYKLILSVSWG